MAADANLLFAQCNAIYVRGVRRAFQERLQSAYGDDWWEMGVMSALQEDQRNNLETQIQRYPARDPVTILDHAHFGWIVRRHARSRVRRYFQRFRHSLPPVPTCRADAGTIGLTFKLCQCTG